LLVGGWEEGEGDRVFGGTGEGGSEEGVLFGEVRREYQYGMVVREGLDTLSEALGGIEVV
uniref:hypothetical protein n=1 Tax=Neisseria sicca TaxID=490 RepID=UPI001C9A0831